MSNSGLQALSSTIQALIHEARSTVICSVNTTMVNTYFNIGKVIVDHEQAGQDKAIYGQATLKQLSVELTEEFGKGFSVDNLENMRKLYVIYGKSETVSRKFKLSWSHYVFLMRLPEYECTFYEIESAEDSTIGSVLCKDKNDSVVDITLPKDNQQIFASQYHTYLPTKEEFMAQIDGVGVDLTDKKQGDQNL